MRKRFTVRRPAAILLLATALFLPVMAGAQTRAESLVADGRRQMSAQSWSEALQSFRAALAADPASGPASFGAGQALMQLGRTVEAAAHFAAAAERGFAVPFARFRQACALASSGETTRAFVALEMAIASGFGDLGALRDEPALATLRALPRFAAMLADAERKARPCEFDGRYRVFDFWVGEWDVYSPQGQRVGVNSIQRLLDSCLLLENWTSISGSSGKSINYLDPATGLWHQNWVDQSGQIIEYEGEFAEGAMSFSGRLTDGAGKVSLSRMRFTPADDGTVKQFIELSADGGETWSTWFDGIYVPKGRPYAGSGN